MCGCRPALILLTSHLSINIGICFFLFFFFRCLYLYFRLCNFCLLPCFQSRHRNFIDQILVFQTFRQCHDRLQTKSFPGCNLLNLCLCFGFIQSDTIFFQKFHRHISELKTLRRNNRMQCAFSGISDTDQKTDLISRNCHGTVCGFGNLKCSLQCLYLRHQLCIFYDFFCFLSPIFSRYFAGCCCQF